MDVFQEKVKGKYVSATVSAKTGEILIQRNVHPIMRDTKQGLDLKN